MKIGEKIRYLRIKNNLTSKKLSEILNISESAISLYENDKRKPTVEQIIKIANYFNVTTDFLLGVSASETDFSEMLEDIITLLNNQNYIVFDGKDIDEKTAVIFKNSLHFLLENMRLITSNSLNN